MQDLVSSALESSFLCISRKRVSIGSKNYYDAQKAWEQRKYICSLGLSIRVYLNDDIYADSEEYPPVPESKWFARDPHTACTLTESVTVTVHDAKTPGYPYLLVLPFMGVHEILNRPANELLGQPASVAKYGIGEARTRVIERAIAHPGLVSEEAYDYYFEALKIKFKMAMRAAYYPDIEEVVVHTYSENGLFQDYWRARALQAS